MSKSISPARLSSRFDFPSSQSSFLPTSSTLTYKSRAHDRDYQKQNEEPPFLISLFTLHPSDNLKWAFTTSLRALSLLSLVIFLIWNHSGYRASQEQLSLLLHGNDVHDNTPLHMYKSLQHYLPQSLQLDTLSSSSPSSSSSSHHVYRTLEYSNDSEHCFPPEHPMPNDAFTLQEERDGAILLHIVCIFYTFLGWNILYINYVEPLVNYIGAEYRLRTNHGSVHLMTLFSSLPVFCVATYAAFFTHRDIGIGTVLGATATNTLSIPIVLFYVLMYRSYKLHKQRQRDGTHTNETSRAPSSHAPHTPAEDSVAAPQFHPSHPNAYPGIHPPPLIPTATMIADAKLQDNKSGASTPHKTPPVSGRRNGLINAATVLTNIIFQRKIEAFNAAHTPTIHVYWWRIARDMVFFSFALLVCVGITISGQVVSWPATFVFMLVLLLYAVIIFRWNDAMFQDLRNSLFQLRKRNKRKIDDGIAQSNLIKFLNSKPFQYFITASIIVSIACVIWDTVKAEAWLISANYVISAIFLFEFMLKHFAFEFLGYWSDPSHAFDGVLCVLILFEFIFGNGAVASSVRAVRLFRFLRALRGLRVVRIMRASKVRKRTQDELTQKSMLDHAAAAMANRDALIKIQKFKESREKEKSERTMKSKRSKSVAPSVTSPSVGLARRHTRHAQNLYQGLAPSSNDVNDKPEIKKGPRKSFKDTPPPPDFNAPSDVDSPQLRPASPSPKPESPVLPSSPPLSPYSSQTQATQFNTQLTQKPSMIQTQFTESELIHRQDTNLNTAETASPPPDQPTLKTHESHDKRKIIIVQNNRSSLGHMHVVATPSNDVISPANVHPQSSDSSSDSTGNDLNMPTLNTVNQPATSSSTTVITLSPRASQPASPTAVTSASPPIHHNSLWRPNINIVTSRTAIITPRHNENARSTDVELVPPKSPSKTIDAWGTGSEKPLTHRISQRESVGLSLQVPSADVAPGPPSPHVHFHVADAVHTNAPEPTPATATSSLSSTTDDQVIPFDSTAADPPLQVIGSGSGNITVVPAKPPASNAPPQRIKSILSNSSAFGRSSNTNQSSTGSTDSPRQHPRKHKQLKDREKDSATPDTPNKAYDSRVDSRAESRADLKSGASFTTTQSSGGSASTHTDATHTHSIMSHFLMMDDETFEDYLTEEELISLDSDQLMKDEEEDESSDEEEEWEEYYQELTYEQAARAGLKIPRLILKQNLALANRQHARPPTRASSPSLNESSPLTARSSTTVLVKKRRVVPKADKKRWTVVPEKYNKYRTTFAFSIMVFIVMIVLIVIAINIKATLGK